jgi:hypothetical protein
MNLRSGRSTSQAETKSANDPNDPKAPHLFQEIAPGNSCCALCTRGRLDPRHKVEEEQSIGRWGL